MFGQVQVSYESGYGNLEIPEKWESLAEDYGGSVEVLLGRPALVQGTTPNHQVLVEVDRTFIRALSVGSVPIERLTELVASIGLTHPVRP
jgi:hypothetical protein